MPVTAPAGVVVMKYVPISAEVRPCGGRPTLFLNGKPTPPVLYGVVGAFGGRWCWEEFAALNIRTFARAGVHLYQVPMSFYDVWRGPDEIYLEPYIRQIESIAEIDPDAAVMIRMHINAPHWWNRAHPEECVVYGDTPAIWQDYDDELHSPMTNDLKPVKVHSYASELWLREASATYEKVLRGLYASEAGARIFSIQIADGVYGENHLFGFLEHDPDLSEPMRRAFSRWLTARYDSDAALQAAWAMEGVTRADPPMPGTLVREQTGLGALRVPSREQWVIDYYKCMHDVVSDVIIHFAGLTKAVWGRPIVTAMFYGYFFSLFGRQAAGGHLGIEKVLNSDKVDCLCAPQSYLRDHRGPGGSGQTRLLMESARLHGKLTLDEMDQPPHTDVAHPIDRDLSNHNMPESLAILRRDVTTSLARGMGMWYYDFGPNNRGGWWLDRELREEVGRLQDLWLDRLNKPYRNDADVLVVFDEKAFFLTANNGHDDPVTDHVALNQLSGALFRSGAAFDAVYLSDLDRVEMDRYRAVIFANTYDLSASAREDIARRVAPGRHIVWFYADGLYRGGDPDTALISELTGLHIVRRDQLAPLRFVREPALGGGEVTFELSYNELYFMFPYLDTGRPKRFKPNFVVDDPDAECVARYAATGDVCGAVRRRDDGAAWYFGIPAADPDILRAIFAEAGAHIYDKDGDSVQVGCGLIVIHTANGGPRTIALRNGKTVAVTLAGFDTAVIDAETGERIM